jgi:hypothetical protein
VSFFYAKARQAFCRGLIDWGPGGDTFRAVLVDTGAYTADAASDEFLSVIPSAARLHEELLTTLEPTDGILDAADLSIVGLTCVSIEAVVIYQDNGSAPASRLILYIDSATGLPITPTGVTFAVTWGNGANRIAKL